MQTTCDDCFNKVSTMIVILLKFKKIFESDMNTIDFTFFMTKYINTAMIKNLELHHVLKRCPSAPVIPTLSPTVVLNRPNDA